MIISLPYIIKWCKEHDENVKKRLPVLYTHGICHLIGYDHEDDEGYEMVNVNVKIKYFIKNLKKFLFIYLFILKNIR